MPSNALYIDQMGRKVAITLSPQRIISLVPSQTELLFDLGLADNIVGITKYCTNPVAEIKNKAKIVGTKQLDIELIKKLNPDLIIANKEENEQSQVEELSGYFPVWVSDIADLDQSLQMIKNIGRITNKNELGNELINRISSSFQQLIPLRPSFSVAYFIWRKPYMLAGNDTFINDLLVRCGLKNVVKMPRYPQISLEKLIDLKPDVILLSSEPYPFREKHTAELKLWLPNTQIYLVDGELFSWYGSRLQHSAAYFKLLIDKIKAQTT